MHICFIFGHRKLVESYGKVMENCNRKVVQTLRTDLNPVNILRIRLLFITHGKRPEIVRSFRLLSPVNSPKLTTTNNSDPPPKHNSLLRYSSQLQQLTSCLS